MPQAPQNYSWEYYANLGKVKPSVPAYNAPAITQEGSTEASKHSFSRGGMPGQPPGQLIPWGGGTYNPNWTGGGYIPGTSAIDWAAANGGVPGLSWGNYMRALQQGAATPQQVAMQNIGAGISHGNNAAIEQGQVKNAAILGALGFNNTIDINGVTRNIPAPDVPLGQYNPPAVHPTPLQNADILHRSFVQDWRAPYSWEGQQRTGMTPYQAPAFAGATPQPVNPVAPAANPVQGILSKNAPEQNGILGNQGNQLIYKAGGYDPGEIPDTNKVTSDQPGYNTTITGARYQDQYGNNQIAGYYYNKNDGKYYPIGAYPDYNTKGWWSKDANGNWAWNGGWRGVANPVQSWNGSGYGGGGGGWSYPSYGGYGGGGYGSSRWFQSLLNWRI